MIKNYVLPLMVLLMMFMSPKTLLANGTSEIETNMKQVIGEVTSIIQDKSMAKPLRDAKVDALVRPLFDFGLMGRLSLGKSAWKKLSKEERAEFSRLFEARVMRSYMSKLDLYTDEVVVIDDAIQVKSRIHLPTRLMRKNEKREILYKFYKSKKRGWLIYDVDILGVSIIQTYRTQFAGILKDDSFAVLLEKLQTSDS
jgi:phospholipid transport system substrate-binding protein